MIHELFPYLHVHDASAAVEFYGKVFGVKELFRLTEPSGRVGHVELDFNGTILMLSEEYPECGILSARTVGATPVSLHLHVDDADAVVAAAVAAGATLEREPQDEFYGERSGVFRDPFGHRWNVGHSIEKVTPEEMQRRYDAMFES
ncbi:VOC family protein [Cellvibrio sp. ARAG 10.3]|uniref:VOC family protein n=1 Tax=Cellvibrio sp. ARAG 10.3 TaxID=3451358 RepID=UPI003F476906